MNLEIYNIFKINLVIVVNYYKNGLKGGFWMINGLNIIEIYIEYL